MANPSTFERILDLGGWFIPNEAATHVVDLMPYETRRVQLTLSPLPGERFTKETWHQADFLSPNFHLPYEDRYFDYVTCGHTVEDLEDPTALLREMIRVAKRGRIVCPSRLQEQTIGVEDRETQQSGHSHHHWIVDDEAGELVVYKKSDSKLQDPTRQVPLAFLERFNNADVRNMTFEWNDTFSFRLVRGQAAADRALEFCSSLQVGRIVRLKDRAFRFARRMRSRLRKHDHGPDWWSEIVKQSLPYSAIEIK